MAITITNVAGITPFREKLSRVAQSMLTGASAETVDILGIGDSMMSSVRYPRKGVFDRKLSFYFRMIERLKNMAGDAGTTWPAVHTDEIYGGGRYVTGVGNTVQLTGCMLGYKIKRKS